MRKFLLILILKLITLNTFGQHIIDYAYPTNYNISKVNVVGIKYLDENTILTTSGLKIGTSIKIPGEEISNAIKKLWKQGLFSNIEIEIANIEDGNIELNLVLTERDRLYKFEYIGIPKSDITVFNEEFKDYIGKILTDNTIKTIKEKILNKYKSKGFYNTEINHKLVPHSVLRNRINLELDIKKNKKVVIDKISISGNKSISNLKLKSFLKKTKENKFLYMFRSHKFDKHLYEVDKDNILSEYRNLGFRDVEIVKDSVYFINKEKIGINIELKEGIKYFVRNISWIGNKEYETSILEKLFKVKKGDVYNQKFINERLKQSKEEDDISTLYLNNGYLFFNVKEIESKIEGDSIDIEMRINEGNKAVIRQIYVTGNTRTKDKIIYRELRSKPGYYFNRSAITRSMRELSQLPYLNPENFDVKPKPDVENQTVDLEYIVGERSSDQIELQGGYGGNRLLGSMGISLNNFASSKIFKKNAWKPVPDGEGESLALRFQTNGDLFNQLSLSFSAPWFGGKKPQSFSSSLAYSESNFNYTDAVGIQKKQSIKTVNFTVGLGKRLKIPDDYFTLSQSITYQHFDLTNYINYFGFNNGVSNNIYYTIVFGRNSVDQIIFPTSGTDISISGSFSPPISYLTGINYDNLNSISEKDQQTKYAWLEFYKLKFNLSNYFSPIGKFVVASRIRIGYLGNYNPAISYIPFNRFYLGGSGLSGYNLQESEIIGLRGYNERSLSPTNGASLFTKIQFELRHPFIANNSMTIFGFAFFEGGNSWTDLRDLNPFNLKRSCGFGIRLFLPALGLIGIDWGYRLDNIDNNPNIPQYQFHFVIGPQN